MAQSVELLLDELAEQSVVAQWELLREAGLPTEWRPGSAPSQRPHVTLYAASTLAEEAEEALPALVSGLDLQLVLGAPLCFPQPLRPSRRERAGAKTVGFVLVRSVLASVPLLALQSRVAKVCGAEGGSHFGPGHYTPHVTLARRLTGFQVGQALDVLAAGRGLVERTVRVTRCRRWDGTAKRDWLLTPR